MNSFLTGVLDSSRELYLGGYKEQYDIATGEKDGVIGLLQRAIDNRDIESVNLLLQYLE